MEIVTINLPWNKVEDLSEIALERGLKHADYGHVGDDETTYDNDEGRHKLNESFEWREVRDHHRSQS
jgi:hypothetical protein